VAARPSQIQREIKRRRAFRSRRQAGLLALLRTADVLRRRVAPILEPHGVTLQQYNVLRILRGAGPEGLPTLEIAERMIEHAPGVTRLLDRLERKKLVRRRRCARDRRQVLCMIREEGLALLSRLDTPMAEADENWAVALRARDVSELIRILDAVREPGSAPAADTGRLVEG